MWRFVLFLTYLFCVTEFSVGEVHYDNTLVLTHIILRHGDRTPDIFGQYPNDPHVNETYYPYGRGQLTLEGKKKAYAVGQHLRKRYNNFLGDVYYPDLLESISSAYPRAKMTSQLVQAGLFAPSEDYKIHEELNWQPIEFRYTKLTEDKLLATFRSCAAFYNMVLRQETKPEHKSYLSRYQDLYKYLSKHSGWDVDTIIKVGYISDSFKSQSEMGLELPDWSKQIWPEPLSAAHKYVWNIIASAPELRRLLIGNFLKKIVDDSIKKIDSSLNPMERKIIIYSGHDFNVVSLLGAFGFLGDLHLPYATYMMLELHNINGTHGLKVYLQDYKTEDPRLIRIGGCDFFCPLEQFVLLMKDNFPENPWCPI